MEIDKLIDSQSVDFNEETRIKTILEVQRKILTEHGPQITLPGGNFYGAYWIYVHNPYQFFLDLGENQTGPPGTDTWTEQATGGR